MYCTTTIIGMLFYKIIESVNYAKNISIYADLPKPVYFLQSISIKISIIELY